MNYSDRDIKRNLFILYVTAILIGLELGIRDFSTTLQVLFEKVGGDNLLILINQFSFYSFILCIFLVGINLSKIKLKKKIAFMEALTFSGYFLIAILLYFDKLSAMILFVIFMCNNIINRLLIVMWLEFKMKLVSNEGFKKLLGNAIFFQMIAIMIGMSVSYLIIGKGYPNNFIVLFLIVSVIGFSVCTMYLLIKEPNNASIDAHTEEIKWKDIKSCMKEKNFINMMISKIMFNLSFGIVVLYAFYAIKHGYPAERIVLMGLISYIFQAVAGAIVGNFRFTNKSAILYGTFFAIASILTVFVLHNMYLGFGLLGFSEPLIHIGYYGFINSVAKNKKHIYLTFETIIHFVIGISVAMFGVLAARLGYENSSYIAVAFLLVACIFTYMLEDEEDGEVNTNDAAIHGD
ncbi:MAG TPA: hypothetical protein DEP72_02825 [Clostridiales bacterium]|nr:MAG: hypothetical protein A2Y18_01085 [Clostridiales bacterium GWD2_32_19]HCC07088.1 hypothetical protein [Clostridiales bacterium]